MPEIIDPVFVKTSPKRAFSMTAYERFGLVSRKRGSINSGTRKEKTKSAPKMKKLKQCNCLLKLSVLSGRLNSSAAERPSLQFKEHF